MNYKVSCPSCGMRASRWRIFGVPSIYCRCRGCGATFGLTAAGWGSMFVVIVVEILLFVLGHSQVISRFVAIGALIATCALAIWLLPYFSPVKLRSQPTRQAV